MKKILIILFIVGLLFSFSCSSKDIKEKSTPQVSKSEKRQEEIEKPSQKISNPEQQEKSIPEQKETYPQISKSEKKQEEIEKPAQKISDTEQQKKLIPEQKETYNHINWFGFEEGLAKAEAEGKDIIIDFYTDWCKWCKVMDESTFSESEVIQFMGENFIPIRIEADDNQKQVEFQNHTFTLRQLTSAFGIKGFPSYGFLNENAQIITVVPGYIKKDMFMNILRYIHLKCYEKQISFDDFVNGKSNCK
ncbi:MAG: DUF255 domain-containing protein [Candidatus Cloacimonetes bacterium]|nr:DUF255 domain-containing protein [Candidatus Cloacimonadota bacterium]